MGVIPEAENQFLQYAVRESKDCIEEFEITDPVEVDVKHTGTKASKTVYLTKERQTSIS